MKRYATAAAVVLVLAFASVSLGVGFVTDDQGFRAKLASPLPHWDLFRFQDGDAELNKAAIRYGHLAWWADLDLKIHFLRPLTSELIAVDDSVFGDAAVGYHAMSLAWFALLLGGVAMLYRKILTPAAATLGVLVFGLASANVDAYAWISARHVVVGAAGAAWALALYARGGRWLGLLPLIVGLAGSECALGAVPIWCALAWRDHRRRDCIPPIVLGLAYLGVYVALGAGTHGSGGYHDPFSDPLGFIWLAFTRVPILLGDAILGVPAELAFVASHALLAVIGLAAVAIAIAAARMTKVPLLLALGGLLALLPGVAGYPAGRVLVVPDLAFAAVLAQIIVAGASARVFAGLLAFAHLIWSPLVALHDIHALAKRGRAVEQVATEVTTLVPAQSRAILIAAADPLVFLYPRGILAKTAPGHVTCWSVLSAAHSSHRLSRTADKVLVLEALDRPLLDGSFDTLFRAKPMAVGDHLDQCGGTIRVAEVKAGLPTKLEITYQRRLDDPKLAFLIWRDGHLEKLELPAIGQSVDLPYSPGISRL